MKHLVGAGGYYLPKSWPLLISLNGVGGPMRLRDDTIIDSFSIMSQAHGSQKIVVQCTLIYEALLLTLIHVWSHSEKNISYRHPTSLGPTTQNMQAD